MKVTRDVMHDLLPAYLAGEASADTVMLVEEFLRQDPDLARTVEALRANPLPELPIAMRPAQEKETLNMTKQLLRWRGILMGLALFLTMLPLSFRFDNGRITWRFLQDFPPEAMAVVCLGALSCWGGFLYVRRRLQGTGL
jgi:anti-sigma factor RsiW